MFRQTMKVAAAVMVALGLLLAAPGGSATAQRRGKNAASTKQPSKKPAKKETARKASSQRNAKTTAKKQPPKKTERVAKRGKADDRKSSKSSRKADTVAKKSTRRVADEPDRTPRRADRRASDVTARSTSSPAREAKKPLADDGEEGEEDDEPAGPRPANKYVASISTGRVIEIQNALIQKGVLVGPPSGVYDQATFQAMSAFQSRNGLGATGMPTAEALKALGVRKNTGVGISSPGRVLETTALDGAGQGAPGAQPRPSVVITPSSPQQ